MFIKARTQFAVLEGIASYPDLPLGELAVYLPVADESEFNCILLSLKRCGKIELVAPAKYKLTETGSAWLEAVNKRRRMREQERLQDQMFERVRKKKASSTKELA